MKLNIHMVVVWAIFFALTQGLEQVGFWKLVGSEAPRGLVYQGTLFILFFIAMNTLVFGPFVRIFQARELETVGKRKQVAKTEEKAQAMMARYQETLDEARLKALRERERLALEAEAQERQSLKDAKDKANAERLRSERDTAMSVEAVRKSLEKEIEDISQELMVLLLANNTKTKATSRRQKAVNR